MSNSLGELAAQYRLRYPHLAVRDPGLRNAGSAGTAYPEFGSELWTAVLGFMQAHLGERVRLTELALACGCGRSQFALRFRQQTGFSPKTFLLCLRIERARQRLADRRANMASIAAELGFCDQSHFIRCFRKVMRQSPGVYARTAATTPAQGQQALDAEHRTDLAPRYFAGAA
jgi:transcriptional regulator GlxA family with amidase domain